MKYLQHDKDNSHDLYYVLDIKLRSYRSLMPTSLKNQVSKILIKTLDTMLPDKLCKLYIINKI